MLLTSRDSTQHTPLNADVVALQCHAFLSEFNLNRRISRPAVGILVFAYPPFTFPDTKIGGGGIDLVFFNNIASSLGFRTELTFLKNYTGRGIDHFPAMARGKFDVILSAISYEPALPAALTRFGLKASPIAAMDKLEIITAEPRLSSESSSGLLGVLRPQVWAVLCLSFLLLRRLQGSLDRLRVRLAAAAPGPLLMTAWWFATGVVLNVFANSLAISLDRPPKPQPLFSTAAELHDLLASRSCRFVSPEARRTDFATLKEYLRMSLGLGAEATDAYQPQLLTVGGRVLVRLIGDSESCHIGATWRTARESAERLSRRLAFVSLAEFPSVPMGFVYRPRTEFASAFEAMTANGEDFAEIYRRHSSAWFAKHIREEEGDYEATTTDSPDDAPLRLGQLADVFTATLALGAVAVAALALENAVERAMERVRLRHKLLISKC